MFVAGFLANGNDNLYTKHELFQILSDETDDLQTGMLDLGDGHKIQAKFTTLDNSEWRRVIAEYEIEHGLPVSVYSKDLNLPDQEARRRIEENPNASCPAKIIAKPFAATHRGRENTIATPFRQSQDANAAQNNTAYPGKTPSLRPPGR